jgi:CheY-like chemotaxis protein
LKCESADLIISDWSMPVMDGLELLKACKGDAALKHIPFIMSSGQGEKADILRAIEAGVDAYIVKPFLPNELQDVLDKIMVKTDPRPRAWRRKLLQSGLRGRRFPGHEERRAFLHRGSVVI